MILEIDNRTDDFTQSEDLEEKIHQYIKAALQVENFSDDVEVSLSFVGDEEIRVLNKDYRSKDSVTDVLSFPTWDEYSRVLGDIVINTSRAKIQAEEIGNSLEEEILYLIVHSIFHLLGYDHIDPDDKKIMREKEKEALKIGGSHA